MFTPFDPVILLSGNAREIIQTRERKKKMLGDLNHSILDNSKYLETI